MSDCLYCADPDKFGLLPAVLKTVKNPESDGTMEITVWIHPDKYPTGPHSGVFCKGPVEADWDPSDEAATECGCAANPVVEEIA